MKALFLTILIVVLSQMIPAVCNAACPTRMDKLDDFARCMVPLKGTIGTASVYSSGQYDEDHRKLMSAMASQAVVSPQVMPAAMPYLNGFYSPFYPFYSPNFYFRAGSNPYFWMYYHP